MQEIEKDKQKVRDEVQRRGLYSVMNDTKWKELIESLESLPFKPAYQYKGVLQDKADPETLEEPPYYLGDWGPEGLEPFFHIEWLKIRPRLSKHQGRLLQPAVIDISDEFVEILEKTGIPFCLDGQDVCIYGYASARTNLVKQR